MLEAIIIILALGGLETYLWHLDNERADLDAKRQEKQTELLDSIWAELAIHNAESDEEDKLDSRP